MTESFDNPGWKSYVDSLAEALLVASQVGLTPSRLVEEAGQKPALAWLLTLDLLGSPTEPLLVRAGRLADLLAVVVFDRIGGRLAAAADPLLGISKEYSGQSYDQRYNTAAYAWNPDYKEARNFYRPSRKIIWDVASELARYREELWAAHRAQEPAPATPARRVSWPIVNGTALVLAISIGFVLYLVRAPSTPATTGAASAASIERRYDGMDPQGKSAPGTTCSDLAHPSQPVDQIHPNVIGPDGRVVGHVELRTSPICPVLWARVYWIGGKYVLPTGWTLRVQMHRRVHPKMIETTPKDTSNYVYGNMLATISGCAYAEVYFTNGSQRTPSAITPCDKSP